MRQLGIIVKEFDCESVAREHWRLAPLDEPCWFRAKDQIRGVGKCPRNPRN
jgi:hypothetical protein